jgi:hypothetical protein
VDSGIKQAATNPVAEYSASESRSRSVINDYEKAMNGYVPQRYSGKVALLWPTESPFEQTDDSTWGWRRVAAEVDVHTVPGGHLTCITKHVKDLSKTLKKCLDEIPTKETPVT